MTYSHCASCGRTVRAENVVTVDGRGYGRTCAQRFRQRAEPTDMGVDRLSGANDRPEVVPDHERDLFGYDLVKAQASAMHRVAVLVESMVIDAHLVVRRQFAAARRRLGVWS